MSSISLSLSLFCLCVNLNNRRGGGGRERRDAVLCWCCWMYWSAAAVLPRYSPISLFSFFLLCNPAAPHIVSCGINDNAPSIIWEAAGAEEKQLFVIYKCSSGNQYDPGDAAALPTRQKKERKVFSSYASCSCWRWTSALSVHIIPAGVDSGALFTLR